MCGRYVLNSIQDFPKSFHLDPQITMFEIKTSFNIAPGSLEPVVVKNSPNHLEMMHWGLIPPWAKDISIGYKMINARAETLSEKPTFKKPFKNKRCLIPASGFYEWQGEGRDKTPYYITVTDQPIFAMAGLYEERLDGEGKTLKSFTIITTQANHFMSSIHTRMPVIISPKNYDTWLDNTTFDQNLLQSLLVPYSSEMHAYPVSKLVNSPANSSESLIYPVS